MPRALVLRTAGTNCDAEMLRAFRLAGAEADLVHLDRAIESPALLDRYDLFGFPGGFSYGDDVASGRIFAMRMKQRLWAALRAAASRGCPMIAACNGFQILVQSGLLPGPALSGAWPEQPPEQEASLSHNAGGRYIDRWVHVKPDPGSVCIWTKGLVPDGTRGAGDAVDDLLMLPIAHGEGRFVTRDAGVLERLRAQGQIALRYGRVGESLKPGQSSPENPNASTDDIAGICDASGRIFGLMPHPERYLDWTRHPFWTRLDDRTRAGETPGLRMFKNAVEASTGVGV